MKYESGSIHRSSSPEDKLQLKLEHDLQERVKELNCLYGFARIIEKYVAKRKLNRIHLWQDYSH